MVALGISTEGVKFPPVRRLRRPWEEPERARALEAQRQITGELERTHAGAGLLAQGGLEETLTPGHRRQLTRTLCSTNPIESMIETIRRVQRKVKRWSSGDMAQLWTADGLFEAEHRFRRVIGCTGLATLALAVEREMHGEL